MRDNSTIYRTREKNTKSSIWIITIESLSPRFLWAFPDTLQLAKLSEIIARIRCKFDRFRTELSCPAIIDEQVEEREKKENPLGSKFE